jgi:Na+/H+ antiporter NhaC
METIGQHSLAGISPSASVLPFALFVTTAIGLSFFGIVDINLLIAVGIVAIIGGSALARNKQDYWTTIFSFFGGRTAVTASLLWLIVGVYGNILKEGHIVEGLVWASGVLDLNGTAFTLVTFLFSGLFAISTGSGFGTISAMSLTLFPAGIAVGGDAALLGGAILSGAALGDSISPVSDTAVIAATTQQYDEEGSVADVGGTVRYRLPIVLWSAVLSVIVFCVAGLWNAETSRSAIEVHPDDYKGLFLLLPTLVVMVLAFRKVNIFVSLFIGIVVAVVLGLTMHLFPSASLIGVAEGHIDGAVVNGIGSMANICLLLMVVVSLSGLIIRSGCMEQMIARLNASVARSQRQTELTIFFLVTIAGILVAAVNTIANICVAPFVNDIGRQQGIHPYRRSAILATVICTFPFILPYGGCLLLLMKGVEASGTGIGLETTDMFFTAFYPWILLMCSLATCFIHPKSKYEKTDETDS